tara:strand:- start:80 stop:1507 length:1428 start_codon:yes stop_codon:yes gene_type:complete
MKPTLLKITLAFVALQLAHTASAQLYKAGDIVENVSLIDRSTGQPVNLYDLEDKVIFLEWFAYWCPFCQQAAKDIEPGLVEYYRNQGGTTEGIEFVHIGINLQGSAENSTQAFIDRYGFGQVLNDFNRSFANKFASGGQPIFAIINGVNNSPSHEQWEIIYSNSGYGNLNTPIATFRNNIDSVGSITELANISTRGRVGIGDDVLIGGFVIEGNENQNVLIQGVGPELIDVLENDNLTAETTLSDPIIFLYGSDGLIVSNDNWETIVDPAADSNASAKSDAMLVAGSFELGSGSNSAAILKSLSPGSYTVIVSGVGGTEGIALVEAYEVKPSTQANEAQLINISTRGRVGINDNALIGGFVVKGALPKTILVQGVGQELAAISDEDSLTSEKTLSDPALTLIDQNGNIIATNDNWESEDQSSKANAMISTGSFGLNTGSTSSAILKELAPGAYTVLLQGTNGEGIALIEAYQVEE